MLYDYNDETDELDAGIIETILAIEVMKERSLNLERQLTSLRHQRNKSKGSNGRKARRGMSTSHIMGQLHRPEAIVPGVSKYVPADESSGVALSSMPTDSRKDIGTSDIDRSKPYSVINGQEFQPPLWLPTESASQTTTAPQLPTVNHHTLFSKKSSDPRSLPSTSMPISKEHYHRKKLIPRIDALYNIPSPLATRQKSGNHRLITAESTPPSPDYLKEIFADLDGSGFNLQS